jgi:hypothetical protein
MENLSINQLESALCAALRQGYNDSYYNSESKDKQEVLRLLEVNDIPNEQAILLNCAYGVGTLMGRNDK